MRFVFLVIKNVIGIVFGGAVMLRQPVWAPSLENAAKGYSVTRIAHPVRNDGFTLIELMIVVVVIAILAAIALPNYSEYVLRSKLVDAGSSLAQLRVSLEQYFQDNRSYDVAPSSPAGTCGVTVSGSDSKYFVYSCVTTSSGQGFTVTATGKSGGGAEAFEYTVDQLNNRDTTAMPSGWSNGSGCWITARGQAC